MCARLSEGLAATACFAVFSASRVQPRDSCNSATRAKDSALDGVSSAARVALVSAASSLKSACWAYDRASHAGAELAVVSTASLAKRKASALSFLTRLMMDDSALASLLFGAAASASPI